MERSRFSMLKSAVQLAILYFPLLSLSDFIESLHPPLSIYAQAFFSALLCFCVLFSENAKTAWRKWVYSVPLTLLFLLLLAATDFNVRLTNKLLTGYGSLSAGAGFAFLIKLASFSVLQGIANLLAAVCSRPINNGKLQKLRCCMQNLILPVICAMILLTVLYLEYTMSTWDAIYRSVYS